ncbi:MAG: ATP-binding protein, partial [Proteobacteria bacterium]|nr:ATP-binding protein [Pseudomonadota bacterium]
MISIVSINLVSFKVGPSVTAIGQIGPVSAPPSRENLEKLSVPWTELQQNTSPFQLLSWHNQISEFAGREKELEDLKAWAESNIRVSVKFVIGEGGAGKSRLGAEFAQRMGKRGWAAGFISPKEPKYFEMKEGGTLLVIDYPEEHRSGVEEFLRYFVEKRPSEKIRVLFLTRQPME